MYNAESQAFAPTPVDATFISSEADLNPVSTKRPTLARVHVIRLNNIKMKHTAVSIAAIKAETGTSHHSMRSASPCGIKAFERWIQC